MKGHFSERKSSENFHSRTNNKLTKQVMFKVLVYLSPVLGNCFDWVGLLFLSESLKSFSETLPQRELNACDFIHF